MDTVLKLPKSIKHKSVEPDPLDLMIQATYRRLHLERVIVGIIIADPGRMIPAADAGGLCLADLSDTGYRLLYLASKEKQHAGAAAVKRFGRLLLQKNRYPIGRWAEKISDQLPSVPYLTTAISRLHDVISKINDAVRYTDTATRLLVEIVDYIEPIQSLRYELAEEFDANPDHIRQEIITFVPLRMRSEK